MKATNHFLRDSDRYALHRPTYPPAFAEALARLCRSRGTALDVGCGTGQLSVLLGDVFGTVVATDSSPEQIAHATPHPKVRYQVSAAEAICAPAASIDLVVAAQAAHWFDLPAFYGAAREMAAPGAIIALVTYGVMTIDDDPVSARFQQFYGEEIGPYWPAERRHVERGYADFDFPFPELEFPRSTIARDWTLDQLLGYVDTWSATRRARAAGAEPVVLAFRSDLRALWGDPARTRRVACPLSGRIGRLAD